MRILAAPLLLIALAGPAEAQTAPRPAVPPAAAPAAPLDPAQEASKSAFERLDEAERKSIQNDLIWSGDFNGVAGGEFGRRTYDAMLGFERRLRLTPDGILAPPERAQLRQAAETARAAVRFGPVTDPATGVRVGLPQALLTQRIAVENGVVWRRPDGQMSLQLGLYPAGASLPALFEQMRQDGPGRKVTYRLQRPDWFVVSGEEGPRKFYTRVAAGAQGVRGYTFRYPAAEAAAGDRLMIAIANSFEPFPAAELPSDAPNARRVTVQPITGQPPLVQPTITVAPPRHAISGVAIGGGRVLTTAAALRSCGSPSIGGQPADATPPTAAGEFAILTPARAPQPAAAFATGEPAFVLSFQTGEPGGVMVSSARREGEGTTSRILAAAQGAAGGAPVIDRQGRVVGLLREAPRARRLIAGVAPEASYALVGSDALGAALSQAGVQPQTAARSPSAAAASLVEIRCARLN